MSPIRVTVASSVAIGLLALLGCSTPLPATAPAPVETASAAATPSTAATAQSAQPATTPAAPGAAAESKVTSVTLPEHLNPGSAINQERSVYFEFDDSALKPEYSALIERHARYLVASAPLSMRVEGHADERGGAEGLRYRIALAPQRDG